MGVQGGIPCVKLGGSGVEVGVDSGVGTCVEIGVSMGVGMEVGVDSGVGTGVEVGVSVGVGMDVGVDSAVGTGVGIGVSMGVGVDVEAGDGVAAAPSTGVEGGEAVGGLAALDGRTSGDPSSAGVAWGVLQAMRNSSVTCSMEIRIGRMTIMAFLTNVTDKGP